MVECRYEHWYDYSPYTENETNGANLRGLVTVSSTFTGNAEKNKNKANSQELVDAVESGCKVLGAVASALLAGERAPHPTLLGMVGKFRRAVGAALLTQELRSVPGPSLSPPPPPVP